MAQVFANLLPTFLPAIHLLHLLRYHLVFVIAVKSNLVIQKWIQRQIYVAHILVQYFSFPSTLLWFSLHFIVLFGAFSQLHTFFFLIQLMLAGYGEVTERGHKLLLWLRSQIKVIWRLTCALTPYIPTLQERIAFRFRFLRLRDETIVTLLFTNSLDSFQR